MEILISNGNWDYSSGSKGIWIGGKFSTPNLSSGYHGILKQWWEYYGKNKKKWLLLSENNSVKSRFESEYPGILFSTSDFFPEMNADCDFNYNVCDASSFTGNETYDIIISQAMFEHVYDPVGALKNISTILSDNGFLILHTVVPGFPYHQFPRDYFRFFPDWFADAPTFIDNIEVKELCVIGYHIFVVYKKHNINLENVDAV
jgi:SAM-dependent methyltransferase